ncbi:MAG: NTP transferase domain-containing protein [Tannerella sp.]|jgi:NDP-sugar pyrophosphorylase family protein|nr:NTP transferase domain-containing protein [Tannerella sp.]
MDYAIIAAGDGSRLAREGISTPKPLLKINGAPMIDRLIDIFIKCNATSVSVIVNEEMTEVSEHIESLRASLPVPLNLLVRSTPSSMHSFYELSRYITGDSVCLTTVDTVFRLPEFRRFVRVFQNDTRSDGMMAITDYIDDEKPLYVKTSTDFTIVGFYDSREEGCRYVSGGVYCLKRKAIDLLEKAISKGMSRMRNYQRLLLSEGLRITAFPFSKIIDVDHREDIDKAEHFLKLMHRCILRNA